MYEARSEGAITSISPTNLRRSSRRIQPTRRSQQFDISSTDYTDDSDDIPQLSSLRIIGTNKSKSEFLVLPADKSPVHLICQKKSENSLSYDMPVISVISNYLPAFRARPEHRGNVLNLCVDRILSHQTGGHSGSCTAGNKYMQGYPTEIFPDLTKVMNFARNFFEETDDVFLDDDGTITFKSSVNTVETTPGKMPDDINILVKWVGTSETYATWEVYKDLLKPNDLFKVANKADLKLLMEQYWDRITKDPPLDKPIKALDALPSFTRGIRLNSYQQRLFFKLFKESKINTLPHDGTTTVFALYFETMKKFFGKTKCNLVIASHERALKWMNTLKHVTNLRCAFFGLDHDARGKIKFYHFGSINYPTIDVLIVSRHTIDAEQAFLNNVVWENAVIDNRERTKSVKLNMNRYFEIGIEKDEGIDQYSYQENITLLDSLEMQQLTQSFTKEKYFNSRTATIDDAVDIFWSTIELLGHPSVCIPSYDPNKVTPKFAEIKNIVAKHNHVAVVANNFNLLRLIYKFFEASDINAGYLITPLDNEAYNSRQAPQVTLIQRGMYSIVLDKIIFDAILFVDVPSCYENDFCYARYLSKNDSFITVYRVVYGGTVETVFLQKLMREPRQDFSKPASPDRLLKYCQRAPVKTSITRIGFQTVDLKTAAQSLSDEIASYDEKPFNNAPPKEYKEHKEHKEHKEPKEVREIEKPVRERELRELREDRFKEKDSWTQKRIFVMIDQIIDSGFRNVESIEVAQGIMILAFSFLKPDQLPQFVIGSAFLWEEVRKQKHPDVTVPPNPWIEVANTSKCVTEHPIASFATIRPRIKANCIRLVTAYETFSVFNVFVAYFPRITPSRFLLPDHLKREVGSSGFIEALAEGKIPRTVNDKLIDQARINCIRHILSFILHQPGLEIPIFASLAKQNWENWSRYEITQIITTISEFGIPLNSEQPDFKEFQAISCIVGKTTARIAEFAQSCFESIINADITKQLVILPESQNDEETQSVGTYIYPNQLTFLKTQSKIMHHARDIVMRLDKEIHVEDDPDGWDSRCDSLLLRGMCVYGYQKAAALHFAPKSSPSFDYEFTESLVGFKAPLQNRGWISRRVKELISVYVSEAVFKPVALPTALLRQRNARPQAQPQTNQNMVILKAAQKPEPPKEKQEDTDEEVEIKEVPKEVLKEVLQKEVVKEEEKPFIREPPKKEIPIPEITIETPIKEPPKKEIPIPEITIETPNKESPKKETPIPEITIETPIKEPPKKEIPIPEITIETPIREPPKKETPIPEITIETPNREPPKKEIPIPEITIETPNREPPKKETPILETPKKEVKVETPIQEIKKETPVEEPKKETPVEEAKKETPVEEAKKEVKAEAPIKEPKKVGRRRKKKEVKEETPSKESKKEEITRPKTRRETRMEALMESKKEEITRPKTRREAQIEALNELKKEEKQRSKTRKEAKTESLIEEPKKETKARTKTKKEPKTRSPKKEVKAEAPIEEPSKEALPKEEVKAEAPIEEPKEANPESNEAQKEEEEPAKSEPQPSEPPKEEPEVTPLPVKEEEKTIIKGRGKVPFIKNESKSRMLKVQIKPEPSEGKKEEEEEVVSEGEDEGKDYDNPKRQYLKKEEKKPVKVGRGRPGRKKKVPTVPEAPKREGIDAFTDRTLPYDEKDPPKLSLALPDTRLRFRFTT